MDELKPCPFCGGAAIEYDYTDGFGVHCGNDECFVDIYATSRDSEADARSLWNRRTPQPVTPAVDHGMSCADMECAYDCSQQVIKDQRARIEYLECTLFELQNAPAATKPVTPAGGEVEPFGHHFWTMDGTELFEVGATVPGIAHRGITALYDHPPVADAALVRDAERYRWLRDFSVNHEGEKGSPWCVYGLGMSDAEPTFGQELEQMIDAALNQRGGG